MNPLIGLAVPHAEEASLDDLEGGGFHRGQKRLLPHLQAVQCETPVFSDGLSLFSLADDMIAIKDASCPMTTHLDGYVFRLELDPFAVEAGDAYCLPYQLSHVHEAFKQERSPWHRWVVDRLQWRHCALLA